MPRQTTQMIKSIENFVEAVRTDSTSWNPKEPKWFRGEPRSLTPLLPTLYREGLAAFENPLLQMFRSRASGYHDVVPDVERTDQWLFLARHAGLPTRLLDWTEGALIGLHFALQEKEPVIWMLNPLELNELAGVRQSADRMREFPVTWVEHGGKNPAFENINGAWVLDQRGVELPVAVYPTYIHARLRPQRSCFTVHGKRKQGLDTLVPDRILKSYAIDPDCRASMLNELRTLGVTDSVVFPDLDGLAKELKARFLK
jgi:FRG domain